MSDAAVIHDIGYRRYTGPRLGRGYATRSLYVHSLRSAFGLGRGLKAKIFPWSVAGLVTLIAAMLTAIASQTGEPVGSYLEFVDVVGLLVMLFLAVVAPELVSRDLRSRAVTLYFSRPLHPRDYVVAKLGALVTATVLLLAVPQLIIFAGAAFDADGPGKVWREFTDLGAGLLYGAVYAVLLSSIALLIASLSGRRAFAAGGIIAAFVATVPVSGVLYVVGDSGALTELSGIVSPSILVQGIGRWIWNHQSLDVGSFGPVYGAAAVALVAACCYLLIVRYRRVES